MHWTSTRMRITLFSQRSQVRGRIVETCTGNALIGCQREREAQLIHKTCLVRCVVDADGGDGGADGADGDGPDNDGDVHAGAAGGGAGNAGDMPLRTGVMPARRRLS